MSSARYLKRRRLLLGRGQWRGLVPIVGTQRRLRALAALGWSWQSLADEAGMEKRTLERLATAARPTVQPKTHDRIAALYERLSMTFGPNPRARNYARRQGWAPPMAWDDVNLDNPAGTPAPMYRRARDGMDETAIERALAGERVKLTVGERREVAQRLAAKGWTASAIARHLGMSGHRVAEILRSAA